LAIGSASVLPATAATQTTTVTTKIPQATVRYQASSASNHKCGQCKLFLAPSDCRFVEGPISSDCSCWIWLGKVG
jgi:hypothetical protein